MNARSCLIGAALSAVLFTPAAASAAPVLWSSASGGNDHYYEFRYDNNNFDNAHASALASTYMGMSGYLATVTSAAEAAFLYNNVSTSIAYIGGSDEGHEGTWTWLEGPEEGGVFYSTTGEPLDYSYSSWLPNEPDNGYPNHGPANALVTNYSQPGGWIDIRAQEQASLGYYVEYSSADVAGAVPEPASWAMMIMGFGMIGGGMRHRQRKTMLRFA